MVGQYIMVGYIKNGYYLWNSEQTKIKVSRDVIFNETINKEVDPNKWENFNIVDEEIETLDIQNIVQEQGVGELNINKTQTEKIEPHISINGTTETELKRSTRIRKPVIQRPKHQNISSTII